MAGDGRPVLVTGANSGIGLATVLEVARAGFHAIGSVRSPAKARIVHQAAAEARVEVETVLLDVTDADRCESLVPSLGLYGLVNNAGYGMTGAVEDVGDDEARAMLETMLVAPMRLTRSTLPVMRANGGGRIVNISSIYGRTTTPLTGWYQGTKHALEALSDALRVEVARDGVQVVLVEPGIVRTAIWDDHDRDIERRRDSRYASAYQRSRDLVDRSGWFMGDPAKVAGVVVRALTSRSPSARYLVGPDARMLDAAGRLVPRRVRDLVERATFGL